jgi:O-antigen/teichoic acid export membrane protein
MLKGCLPQKLLPEKLWPFYLMVAGSLFYYVVGYVISFVASVFVTRHIGPQGQGQVAFVFALINIGIILARAGMGNIIKICVTENPRWVGGLFARTSLVSLAASVAVIPLLYWAGQPSELTPDDRVLLLTGLMFIPLIIISVNATDILMGMHRSRQYNSVFMIEKLAFAFSSALFIITGVITPLTALLCLCCSMVLRLLPFWYFYREDLTAHAIRQNPLPRLDRKMIAVDFPASICFAFAPSFMPILLSLLSGFDETGYYGVAANMGNMLLVLPSLYASYAINKLVSEKHNEDYGTLKLWLLGSILAVMLAMTGFFYLIADWLIPFLFGSQFVMASSAFKALLPSVLFIAGYQIMNAFLLAERKLTFFLLFALLFALLVTMMPFILAQPMTATYAAQSYSLATGVVFLCVLGHFIATGKNRTMPA